MRRIVILLVVCVMCLGMCACGSAGGKDCPDCVSGKKLCTNCDGGDELCSQCRGRGKCDQLSEDGTVYDTCFSCDGVGYKECPMCHGDGILEKDCEKCNGKGQLS